MKKEIILKFSLNVKQDTSETSNDAVMEKVDDKGNVLGFSILKMSALRGRKPLFVKLASEAA